MPAPPKLYTSKEAAALLRLHPITLRKRVASREYPSLKIGGRVYLTDDHIKQILRDAERPAIQPA